MALKDFKGHYEEARQQHPNIIHLDDDHIDAFEDDLQKHSAADKTTIYIFSVSSAIFFLASYPWLIARSYELAISIQSQLWLGLSRRVYLDNHIEVIIASAIVFSAVIFYTLVLTRLETSQRSLFAKYLASKLVIGINRKSVRYVTFALFANYFNILIPLLYLYSYQSAHESILKWVTVIWLMLPLAVLSILPTVILFFSLATLYFFWHRRNNRPNAASIVIELIHLLKELDDVSSLKSMKQSQRENIAIYITEISRQIMAMYDKHAQLNGAAQWSLSEMRRAGLNFLSLCSWIYFPQPETIECLKQRVCWYINIFLSGTYHELPREEVGEQRGIAFIDQRARGLRRIIEFLSFALYMGIPIATFAIIIAFFHVDVPALIQSALSLLYVIWAIFGFLSFSDKIAPDAKILLSDIIKAFIQRK